MQTSVYLGYPGYKCYPDYKYRWPHFGMLPPSRIAGTRRLFDSLVLLESLIVRGRRQHERRQELLEPANQLLTKENVGGCCEISSGWMNGKSTHNEYTSDYAGRKDVNQLCFAHDGTRQTKACRP